MSDDSPFAPMTEEEQEAHAYDAESPSDVEALRQSIEASRETYAPGTPEKYPRAELRGLTILEADALLARLEQCGKDGSEAADEASALKARLEQTERELEMYKRLARKADFDLGAAERALREALDIIVWMSGADDFGPGGKAEQGWKEARDKLDPLFLLARAALASEGEWRALDGWKQEKGREST